MRRDRYGVKPVMKFSAIYQFLTSLVFFVNDTILFFSGDADTGVLTGILL